MKKISTSEHFKTVPWKNGGGTTLELFRLENPTDPEKFLLRLSIATVDQSGPFSLFPGIDRHLLLLSGKGMNLNSKPLIKHFDPIKFSGEEQIESELLAGTCTDFNVMIDRTWGKATLNIVHLRLGDAFEALKPNWMFVYQYETQTLIEARQENLNFYASTNMRCIVIRIQQT